MSNSIRETVLNVWDSTFGRLAVLAVSLGFVPFYLLSMAVASL